MRPRWVLATCVAAVVGLALLAVPSTRMALASLGSRSKAVAAGAGPSQPETRNVQIVAQAPPPPPTLRAPASPGAVKGPGSASFFGWAFLDRRSGTMTGSANSGTGTNSTESMVKAFITGDYLRRLDVERISIEPHDPVGPGGIGDGHQAIQDRALPVQRADHRWVEAELDGQGEVLEGVRRALREVLIVSSMAERERRRKSARARSLKQNAGVRGDGGG